MAPDAPVFAEPWQAQAFALTVGLHERGLFSWGEWAAALSAEVHRPDAAPDSHDYYAHWLAALEKLLAAKGFAARAMSTRLPPPGSAPRTRRPMASRSFWRTIRGLPARFT